jgi:exopolysaccharide biosynthesis predicted pyruvyltransferase EpsI
MKTIIHVNQHVIKRNSKLGENNPVLTVKTYNNNTYAHTVEIQGPSRIIYSPDKPLSCGARVWIETTAPVILGGSHE